MPELNREQHRADEIERIATEAAQAETDLNDRANTLVALLEGAGVESTVVIPERTVSLRDLVVTEIINDGDTRTDQEIADHMTTYLQP